MAPVRVKKERPANLRQRPRKSAKAGGSSDSSGEELVTSEREPMSSDREPSPEGNRSSNTSIGETVGNQGEPQGADLTGQDSIFQEMLGEMRALRGSVENLRRQHNKTDRRLKAVEMEGKGKRRKRARSSDLSSSESDSRSRRFKSLKSSFPASSSESDSEDSDSSMPRDRESAWGASIPIDASIPDKIKSRIWKGKFVEFRYLLDPEERPAKQRKLQLKISAVDSEVHTVAAQEPGPLADFALWDKAFHVFMAITMKSPKGGGSRLLDNLLIYRKSIQTMQQAGGDWERYDTKFRNAMTYLPKQMKWQRRQYDLWDDCMRKGKAEQKKSVQPSTKGASNAKIFPAKTGYCYAFQRGGGKCDRDDCRYRHACSVCRSANHGAQKCPKATSEGRTGDRQEGKKV